MILSTKKPRCVFLEIPSPSWLLFVRAESSWQKTSGPYFCRWVFPKIVVPQNGWFIMENPIKWMITTIFGNIQILLEGPLFLNDKFGWSMIVTCILWHDPLIWLVNLLGETWPKAINWGSWNLMLHYPKLKVCAWQAPPGHLSISEPWGSSRSSVWRNANYQKPLGNYTCNIIQPVSIC